MDAEEEMEQLTEENASMQESLIGAKENIESLQTDLAHMTISRDLHKKIKENVYAKLKKLRPFVQKIARMEKGTSRHNAPDILNTLNKLIDLADELCIDPESSAE